MYLRGRVLDRWLSTLSHICYSLLSYFVDVTICELGTYTCGSYTTCISTTSSYRCVCIDDYSLDHGICVKDNDSKFYSYKYSIHSTSNFKRSIALFAFSAACSSLDNDIFEFDHDNTENNTFLILFMSIVFTKTIVISCDVY